jgi:hypothetical protein
VGCCFDKHSKCESNFGTEQWAGAVKTPRRLQVRGVRGKCGVCNQKWRKEDSHGRRKQLSPAVVCKAGKVPHELGNGTKDYSSRLLKELP